MPSAIDTSAAPGLDGIIRPVDSQGEAPPMMTREQKLLSEDLATVVRVAFAERFAGFTRMLGANGWVWTRTLETKESEAVAPALEPLELDELPHVEGTGFSLVEYLDEYCRGINTRAPEGCSVVWAIQMWRAADEEGLPVYQCTLFETNPQAKGVVAKMRHTDPAMVIALAMLFVIQADLPGLHKELFPGKYMGL